MLTLIQRWLGQGLLCDVLAFSITRYGNQSHLAICLMVGISKPVLSHISFALAASFSAALGAFGSSSSGDRSDSIDGVVERRGIVREAILLAARPEWQAAYY